MESEKILETMKEKGFLETKLGETENPDVKFLEVYRGHIVCENDGIVSVDKVDFSNVGERKELGGDNFSGICFEGFGNVKESLVGKNVADTAIGGSIPVNDINEVKNGDFSVSEVDLPLNADLLHLEKDAAVDGEKRIEKSLLEVDELEGEGVTRYSTEKIEDSGDGINLFVDVFGPSNGLEQIDDVRSRVERDLEKTGSQQDNVEEANGTGCGDFDAKQENLVEGELASYLHCPFNIGDVVWVMTNTQLWWPGIVSDPSYAAKDTSKSDKAIILVKYFSSANIMWRSPSQLKPFLENLEPMSKQNNSRSFLGAIDMAICEIGRRVKSEMTCSCFLKESQRGAAHIHVPSNKIDASLKEKMGGIGAFSASQFEPATFVQDIRSLARCISMPGKADFVIIQNRLSAFYHSLGHLQLPMHRLRPTTEDKDRAKEGPESERKVADLVALSRGDSICSQKLDHDSTKGSGCKGELTQHREMPNAENCDLNSERKSGNGSGFRERRKSKYLSYPYADEDSKGGSRPRGTADATSSQRVKSTPLTMSKGKTRTTASRKPITDESTDFGAEITNVYTVKMLMDLRSTALNYPYQKRGECADLIRKFFMSFRKFAFLDPEMAKQQVPSHERVNSSGNGVGSKGGNPQELSHCSPRVNLKKLARQKKEVAGPSGLAPCPAAVGLATLNNDSQDTGHEMAKSPKVPKKRKKREETTSGPGLPDLNGNNTNLTATALLVTALAASHGKLEPKRRKKKHVVASSSLQTEPGATMPDVNGDNLKIAQLPENIHGRIPSLNNSNNQPGAAMLDASGNNVEVPEVLENMQASTPSLNNTNDNNETAAVFPNSECMARQSDATEQAVESSSSMRPTMRMNLIFPNLDPAPKKRKRKEKTTNLPAANCASAIPDLNGNVVAESVPSGKDVPGTSSVSPGAKPQPKRRRKKAIFGPDKNTNYSMKMQNHVEALAAVLLLNFVPGAPLPSQEFLISTFSVFGALKESETQVLNNSSAQIVFVKSSNAGVAYRSLEKTNPFGPSLASFRLNYLSSPSRIPEPTHGLQMPPSFHAPNGLMAPEILSPLKPHNGNVPDLLSMKRNLDIMQSMLKTSGNNLSPDTKAKLENEIKGFMSKISSLVGSTSS